MHTKQSLENLKKKKANLTSNDILSKVRFGLNQWFDNKANLLLNEETNLYIVGVYQEFAS